jgi:hypothetical protein
MGENLHSMLTRVARMPDEQVRQTDYMCIKKEHALNSLSHATYL